MANTNLEKVNHYELAPAVITEVSQIHSITKESIGSIYDALLATKYATGYEANNPIDCPA